MDTHGNGVDYIEDKREIPKEFEYIYKQQAGITSKIMKEKGNGNDDLQ